MEDAAPSNKCLLQAPMTGDVLGAHRVTQWMLKMAMKVRHFAHHRHAPPSPQSSTAAHPSISPQQEATTGPPCLQPEMWIPALVPMEHTTVTEASQGQPQQQQQEQQQLPHHHHSVPQPQASGSTNPSLRMDRVMSAQMQWLRSRGVTQEELASFLAQAQAQASAAAGVAALSAAVGLRASPVRSEGGASLPPPANAAEHSWPGGQKADHVQNGRVMPHSRFGPFSLHSSLLHSPTRTQQTQDEANMASRTPLLLPPPQPVATSPPPLQRHTKAEPLKQEQGTPLPPGPFHSSHNMCSTDATSPWELATAISNPLFVGPEEEDAADQVLAENGFGVEERGAGQVGGSDIINTEAGHLDLWASQPQTVQAFHCTRTASRHSSNIDQASYNQGAWAGTQAYMFLRL